MRLPQDRILHIDTELKDGKVNIVAKWQGELVRCKDCKHLRLDSDFVKGRYCSIRNVNGGGFCKDEDYCSYGERKGGDDE